MQILKLDKREAGKLLASDKTLAFTLMTILLSKYGQDVFDLKTPVLFNMLEEDFNIKLPEEAENRINAALTAMQTDLFYTQYPAFKSITMALNSGDIGGFADEDGSDDKDEISTAEILWAISEVGLLNGLNFKESSDNISDDIIEKCNEIIDDESEDLDEVDDDVDTISEAYEEPYYYRAVANGALTLAIQLLKLGVDPDIVSEILEQFDRKIDDIATMDNDDEDD